MAPPLHVGIIGTGGVGQALGGRLLAAGTASKAQASQLQVQYGSRNPASHKVRRLLHSQPGAAADTVPATAAWADVLLLCTPAPGSDAGYADLAESLGAGVKGKVVLDATNPLSEYPGLELAWGGDGRSGGERLAAALPPETAVFKAFNTIGKEHMAHPDGSLIGCGPLTMLLAGGPRERLAEAERVVAAAGFVPKYVGSIRYARNLEAIAELWVHLSLGPVGDSSVDWGRNFHFQVVDDRQAKQAQQEREG